VQLRAQLPSNSAARTMLTRNLLPLTAAVLLLAVLQCVSAAAAAAAAAASAGRSAAAPGLPLDANAVASEDATTAPRARAATTTAAAAAATAVILPAAAAARVKAADRSATVVFYNSTNVVSFRNGTDTTAVDENGRFSVAGLVGMAWAAMAGFATALLFVPSYVVGRGLHSFTVQLNVSALYEIGGALRGCLGGDKVVSGVSTGCWGAFRVRNGSG